MRITIVQGAFLPVPPVSGGAVEKIWFALGKEFARRGHEVTHVSRQHEGLAQEEFVEGVHHLRVRGFDTPSSLARLKWRDLLYTRKAIRALPEADILVTNTFWAPMLSRDRKRGRICVHVARFPRGQMKFYGSAARLHTVSNAVGEAICSEAPSMASRVKVIPNFVDLPPDRFSDCKRNTEILYVGRIHPEKGMHILVDAFRSLVEGGLRNWRLRIVGPWEVKFGGGGEQYLTSLRKQSKKLGQLVDWEGAVFDADDLRARYKQSSIFVYPSLAERGETFGLAPLEAMAARCPPVVSSLECFRDFVKPGINGWIFDHRSSNPAADLAKTLKQVISDSDGLDRARQAAYETAKDFSLPRIADQYLADFAEIVRQ